MKRFMMLFLVLIVMFTVSACSSDYPQSSDQSTNNQSNQSTQSTQSNQSSTSQTTESSQSTSSQSSQATSSSSTATPGRVFTEEELTRYNGKNGQPAYVAIGGIVYDVTSSPEWQNGQHKDHCAGFDLSASMKTAPHGNEVMKDFPIVGTLK